MNRTTCEHFVPIELKCDKCDNLWDANTFELLHGYRNVAIETLSYTSTALIKDKEYMRLKSVWSDKISELEQKFKKLK